MQDDQTRNRYEIRLQRVLNHIHDHLDEDLDTARLAEVACLSPYHWHRIYLAITGETLVSTVRRLRLHRAAGDLILTSQPICEIAARWGYPEIASFTRTFAAAYGMPPGRFREAGRLRAFQWATNSGEPLMSNVEIAEIAPITTIGLPHAGSYMAIGRSFDELYGLAHTRGLLGPDTRSLAIYYDDPSLTETDNLRSFACLGVKEDIATAPPLEKRVIAGGTYAVIVHKGPYADMPLSYNAIYGGWLPTSGRQVRDAPAFEEYLNDPRSTQPTDLLTKIYLPII